MRGCTRAATAVVRWCIHPPARTEEGTTRWFPPRAPPSCATGRGAMAGVPWAALAWTVEERRSSRAPQHAGGPAARHWYQAGGLEAHAGCPVV